MHCLLNMNMVNSLLMDTSITWAPLCKTGLHLELVPPFIWLSTRRKSLLDGYLVSVLKVSIFIKESESRKFFFGLFSHSQKTHLFALLAPFTDCYDKFPYPFIKFYLWNPYHNYVQNLKKVPLLGGTSLRRPILEPAPGSRRHVFSWE